MSFTKEQKQKYLENPEVCPFCGKEYLTGRHFNGSYNQAWREIECDSCGKEWMELFTMTDIEEQEDLWNQNGKK